MCTLWVSVVPLPPCEILQNKAAEADAEKQHLGFMTETSMSLAEKNMAKKEKQSLKDSGNPMPPVPGT